MEDLWLSGPILSLKRTLTEKIVLACICQQAAQQGGYCIDTNKELAQALAIHHQTVSDAVGRLREAALLVSSVVRDENDPDHQRALTPSTDLLKPYESFARGLDQLTPVDDLPPPKPLTYGCELTPKSSTYGGVSHRLRGNKSIAYGGGQTPVAREVRYCPITQLEITHQRPSSRFATENTLRSLLRSDRAEFDKLAKRLLTPEQATGSAIRRLLDIKWQIIRANKAAKKLVEL